MQKILLSLFMIVGINLSCFAAQNATDIYLLAQAKNTTELKKVENIDATNSDGDTALCIAIKYNDVDAYNVLQKSGANTNHKCIKNIQKEQYNTFMNKVAATNKPWSFLGLGKWGWGAIGAGVLGGAVVVAGSGGGGGSGGGANATPNEPNDDKSNEPIVLNCAHGTQIANACICDTGYTGSLCDELVQCPYTTTSCETGFQETGNTCQSGDTLYKECAGITCGANATLTSSGCECNSGYTNWQDGQGCSLIPLDCGENAQQKGTSCVCNDGYGNWQAGVGCTVSGMNYYGTKHITSSDGLDIIGKKSTTNQSAANYGIYITKNIPTYSRATVTGKDGGANAADGLGIININKTGNGDVYGLIGNFNAVRYSYYETAGYIIIDNTGYGNIYGIKGDVNASSNSTGKIRITNAQNSGRVYGMYTTHTRAANAYNSGGANASIDIFNQGSGSIFGLYAENGGNEVANVLISTANTSMNGTINIENHNDSASIFGTYNAQYNSGALYNSGQTQSPIVAAITITNYGSGNSYGMYNTVNTNPSNAAGGNGIINMYNIGNGNAYGLYSTTTGNNGEGLNNSYKYATSLDSTGIINIINYGHGNGIGMYGYQNVYNENNISTNRQNKSIINMQNLSDGKVIGITNVAIGDQKNYVFNSGTISINNIGTGMAIGIFADRNTIVSNTGSINITRDNYIDKDNMAYVPQSERGGTAIGIYATSGATVNNSGTITINGATTAYGIYAESGATVTNTGTISIDGDENHANAIVLNGGVLFQNGELIANTLNLDDMGGAVIAGANSQFIAENDISGTLNISSDIVADGFDTTYTAKNMIQAGDTSKLNLRSGSAMFDANLADNGNDVVMTMKSFDTLTDNKSLAAYLADNYAKGTSAEFFGGLKSGTNMAEFNNILNGLSGLNAFTQFDREDMSAMREINFSMNQQMFMNGDRDEYQVSGSMEHFSFSNSSNGGSGSYGISNSRMSDNWKLGYGLAMANIGTNDDLGTSRSNQIGLFYMPMTYTGDDIEFISTPRVGFAKSHYNRRGYNDMNYDGYIEKQIFGFNNDLRYPVSFGNWTIAPDLGLNAIMYRQSGHESDQAFSLIIPADEIYSVEAGFGLFTKYEQQLSSGGSLQFNSGIMLYRELADTYNMKLGIRGLDGTFNLYDDAEHDYSGAATIGFDYKTGRFDVYGNAQYFMDGDHYMNLKSGIRYWF
ncbi:hypothetical protein HDR61_01670 [bacterium]|nr:hypothetical protein [bacterium]